MKFKLGFGPMSREIVDIIGEYTISKQSPLMIIASRNQVDESSGYVMTTAELSNQVKKYDRNLLWLCRDHCGPYFLDSEKNLSEREAIEATKKTIAKDIENNFDLIHIDTSRCIQGYKVAEELINFCLDLNPDIKFEFGTEENVGVAAGIEKYKNDVEFASQFPNMIFVVAQTGSLVMEDRQVGTFNVDAVKKLVSYANASSVLLKEHNADYLTKEQISLRKDMGVHALNIAPQLGVIQTKILRRLSAENGLKSEWEAFSKDVLSSNKWKKWIIDGNDEIKVDIAGHYLYNSTTHKNLCDKLEDKYQNNLKSELFTLFDLYVNNIS